MRVRKHIALVGLVIIFSILAIGINFYQDKEIRQGQILNAGGLCINEVCSDYFPTSFSQTQPASDWIELYNRSDENIQLKEYYLSDDKNNLYKYQLPDYELAPKCYYVLHSETEEIVKEEEGLNFRIDSQGETIYLSNREGVLDVVNIPAMDTNTSWSRLADIEQWANTEMSYGIANVRVDLIKEEIEPPVFSLKSGFYEKEFELELSAGSGSSIYYTLDGSDPDKNGILYQTPILITDVSENANVYSSREDFNPLHEGMTEECVEKITIVRAVTVDDRGNKSNVVTNSYIVGNKENTNYEEMYTVSLVTDPYNLFDYEEGIYVTGKVYDEFVAKGGDLSDEIQADANYRIRGKRSERPASIEIFDENGNVILDREVGIRIHGSTTRGSAQKSFSVYAREMYDGTDTIEDLFGEGTFVHKFFIYANREGTKLRDPLLSKTLEDRNMATQSFIHCNVFLDGEYWGVYLLAEVYDEYYFENNYGISRDNIQIHEGAIPPDVEEYLLTVSDKSDVMVYERICEMIDVQSFVEYYAAMLYLNNEDWLFHNARCYRSKAIGTGENEDGKWRWGVWDSEGAMYNALANTFETGNIATWEEDILAQTLMEHEEFRRQFVITYMDMYNNIWQEDIILPVISELESGISKSYAMHSKRFWNGIDTSEYIEKLKSFFTQRDEYAFIHVKEEFDLSSEPMWFVLLSNVEHPASFRVNTTCIDMPGAWWQGLYFADYPIEVSVDEVYDDRVFVGWYTENDELLSDEKTLVINLQENTNVIYAKFSEE